ncbi:MAG: hypothetical protein Q7S92_00815 [Candidatus Diapherotrites archaeon]|nr:hypothetical protein [Candidatus Diapherotrites archaeon]
MGLFVNAWKVYLGSLSVSLWFALLLVFTAWFPVFFNMIYSSGTVFWEYGFTETQTLLVELLSVIVYVLVYSFFLCMVVFGVRKELSAVRIQYYFKEVLSKIAFKMFAFYILYSLLLIVLAFGLFAVKIPLLGIAVVLLILSIPTLFMPQIIVIEELPIFEALAESLDFTKRNWRFTGMILVLGSILLAILLFIEFAIDTAFPSLFAGRIVSLLLALLFVIPFLESLKTYFYMMKYGIIRSIEELHHR